MASNGRKPTTKAPAAGGAKVAAKAPAKAPVAAKPAVPSPAKPDTVPAAAKAPAAAAPVTTKPVVPPVVAKIEPPAPAPVVAKAPLEPVTAKPVLAPTPVEKVVAVPPAAIQEARMAEPEAPAPKTPEKPAPAAVETPVAIIQKEVKTMEANLKNAAEKAQSLFAEANERAKAAVEKGTKMFEEANEFSKGNIEAIVESGKIAAKGMESLGQEAADYGRKHFEGVTAALKSLSTVKSPTDFFKLHSDYVRSSFDSIVAQTSKNTEAMLKLAGEVAQPISNRVAIAAEKVKISA